MHEPAVSQRENTSSIELHRDAKGAYSWTAKLYFDASDTEDDQTTDALDKIASVDRRLRLAYLS